MVSQKAKQLQKTRVHPESLDAENYGNTEDEDHHNSDTSVLLQHGLNQHKESSESDLEDNFWNCRENPSDRRKVRCKRLERKNVELSRVLKKSETRLGLAKRDCIDTKRAYRGAKREAQGAKAELQSFEQTTKESISNCSELMGHYQDAVVMYRKQRDYAIMILNDVLKHYNRLTNRALKKHGDNIEDVLGDTTTLVNESLSRLRAELCRPRLDYKFKRAVHMNVTMYRDNANYNEPKGELEEDGLSSLQLDTDEDGEHMDCLSSEDETDNQHASLPTTLMALGEESKAAIKRAATLMNTGEV
jgi:hypothetical protein